MSAILNSQYGSKNGNIYFQKTAKAIVKKSAKFLQGEKPEQLKKLFFLLLEQYGEKRAEIAFKTQSADYKSFGKRRDQPSDNKEFAEVHLTPLDANYKSTNQAILCWLAEKIAQQRINADAPASTCFNRATYSADHSRQHVEVLENPSEEFLVQSNFENYEGHTKWAQKNPEDSITLNRNLCLNYLMVRYPTLDNILAKDSVLLEHYHSLIGKKRRDLGVHDVMRRSALVYRSILEAMNRALNCDLEKMCIGSKDLALKSIGKMLIRNKKNLFLAASAELEVNGRLLPVAQYLTWLYRDYTHDPIDRMKTNSKVILCHLPYYHVNEMLEDIAGVFERAILCNNVEELKLLVGEFRFKFSFAMPFKRGSASIAEWFEQVIYLFHQYKLSPHKKQIDLLAFEKPNIKEFLAEYLSITKIKSV